MNLQTGLSTVEGLLTGVVLIALLWLLVRSLFAAQKGQPQRTWNISLAALIPTVVLGGLIAAGLLVVGADVARQFGIG